MLKTFFKRHVTLVVMVAVNIPLLIILLVQYRSLVELERTMPIANKAWMRKFLVTVDSQIEDFYKETADKTLTIPAGTFERGSFPNRVSDIGIYFQNNPPRGAKRLFVGFTGEDMGKDYSIVLFYDPKTNEFHREPGSQQWRAAHAASSYWLYHSIINAVPRTTSMCVDEQDRENPIITKPILDKESKVIGAVGMIVDDVYFRKEILPCMINRTIRQFFPDDHQNVIVALYDPKGNLALATESIEGKKFEVGEQLQFIFKNWYLKILMRNSTQEQAAKRVFAINISLSTFMMCLLVGVVFMTIRTATREMKLSQMKADFVSNVSHELRTPLASIRVFGEFMRLNRVRDREKINEYGEYIENESRRLTQLINNILDFSRIESGRKTYNFEEADLVDIVTESLKSAHVRLSQNGFNILFETSDEPLPLAVMDPDAISQAFMNLLDNAVKYSGTSKEIIVRIDKKDDFLTLSVTDHGIGIPKEEQEKIFEKFYRVSTGLVHDVKGSGLGLSIVKHTMEAHHGLVTVESRPGAGSTFTMYLPEAGSLKTKTPFRKQKPADNNAA